MQIIIMKRKEIIIKKFLAFILCLAFLILTGCGTKSIEGKISINCNGEKSSIEIKANKTFKCKLLQKNYKFTIKSISDDEIIINTPDRGLTQTGLFYEEYHDFVIEKGKESQIVTQSFDYQEYLILYWE